MKQRLFVLVILASAILQSGYSQILDPIKWSFSSNKSGDNGYELLLTATIDDGWHMYSQDIPNDGPVPTSFQFKESSDYQLIGKVEESDNREEAYDPNFDMILKWFSHKAVFTQKIKVLTDKPFTLSGDLEYMCCDDKQCLAPQVVDFEFKLEGISQGKTENNNSAEEETANNNEAIAADTVPDSSGAALSGSNGISEGAATAAETSGIDSALPEDTEDGSLWMFFILSLLAGFAAVLTPCVFPMIPMTVTFFMQSSEKNRGKSALQGIIYGTSIIVIYTAIGLIVAATLGPGFINWLSTHWFPNIFFFLLFAVFAASFFGMFEIVLPSWIVNISDKQADKGGYISTFFMALTLVLVSFSCTAPLVGGLLVEAATGAVIKPVVGMFGFSLAFAFPFTLLAFFPSWLSKMPQSGGWLNSVKVVLGFVILALGMKFLIIPDQTYHWGLLDREIYLAIWIVLFSLMGLYLMGKIKFAHDSPMPHISVPRLLLVIITFTFVLYLIPGMFGAPLKAISGLLPPVSSHDFDLKTMISENAGGNAASSKAEYPGLCDEAPRFADFLHFPHGLKGYFDYEEGMACAKKLNKPLFLDFNGHGCANCKAMEASVWSEPGVLKRLRDDFVLIALYVDDKKELPETEWVTSTYDGKVKKTIGSINADFQIEKFEMNSQPYYVLLDHKGKMLNKPIGRENTETFTAFLDEGLDAFQERSSKSQAPKPKHQIPIPIIIGTKTQTLPAARN